MQRCGLGLWDRQTDGQIAALLYAAFRRAGNNNVHEPPRCFALCRLGDILVVVGNVGDSSVSSYRLHASETQQL